MRESLENQTQPFKFPDIFAESGELERVGKEFGIELSVLEFQAQNGELVPLESDIWNDLENTDSIAIEVGDWEKVAEMSSPVERDWKDLRDKLAKGVTLEAPIVMKFCERYHLVSGNTRLMVCKAEGITPKVLLFEIDLET